MMDKIKFLMSSMWEFLLPFIKVLISTSGPALAKAAEDAVRVVALTMKDQSGPDKQKAAFNIILVALTSVGITLARSVVNTAIELAYQKYQEVEK